MRQNGTWWIRSETDPRWDAQGSASVGGFCMPPEVEQAIKSKKETLGDPPDDLESGYIKD